MYLVDLFYVEEFKSVLREHNTEEVSGSVPIISSLSILTNWYLLMGSTDNVYYKLKYFCDSTGNISKFIILFRIKIMQLLTRTHIRFFFFFEKNTGSITLSIKLILLWYTLSSSTILLHRYNMQNILHTQRLWAVLGFTVDHLILTNEKASLYNPAYHC